MTRYLIDDVGADNYHARLQEFGEILRGREMTLEIERWNKWGDFNPATTLLVFPGNGANLVRGFMRAEWLLRWRTASAVAKRSWLPGTPPYAFAGRICHDRFILDVKDVVVIDDVISSGETMKKLRAANMPWISTARWHAVTWVMQKAALVVRMSNSHHVEVAKLNGFESHHAVVEVGELEHKVPINSLSTLIENSEIAESYARRNFPSNFEAFLALINELR